MTVRVYEIEYQAIPRLSVGTAYKGSISTEVFIIKGGYVEEAAKMLKEKYKNHKGMALGRILSISLLCETVKENVSI